MNNGHAGRLADFIATLERDVYPEPQCAGHTVITKKMFNYLCGVRGVVELPPRARVLDVGCGQGPALEMFRACDFEATGIGIGEEDLAECRKRGFSVERMDQSFLEFPDSTFDLVWARHVLEHSIAPYFTLKGFQRVAKPGGALYVEVPAPETPSHHERNRNHYSVLPKGAWQELIRRAGFTLLDTVDITLTVSNYHDLYWAFIGRRA